MTALLLGATGLVGSHLLHLMAGDSRFSLVTTLGRRPMEAASPTHTHHVADFDHLDAEAGHFAVDAVFCALGTTIKQAGSEEAFRRVDYDYPVEAARLGHAQGAAQYLLVSSIGANPKSRLFYPRIKGEVEETLKGVGFERLSIFRPSQLAGARTDERPKEALALGLLKVAAPVLIGPLRKYRITPAETLAKAMVTVAFALPEGVAVYEADALPALATAAR